MSLPKTSNGSILFYFLLTTTFPVLLKEKMLSPLTCNCSFFPLKLPMWLCSACRPVCHAPPSWSRLSFTLEKGFSTTWGGVENYWYVDPAPKKVVGLGTGIPPSQNTHTPATLMYCKLWKPLLAIIIFFFQSLPPRLLCSDLSPCFLTLISNGLWSSPRRIIQHITASSLLTTEGHMWNESKIHCPKTTYLPSKSDLGHPGRASP